MSYWQTGKPRAPGAAHDRHGEDLKDPEAVPFTYTMDPFLRASQPHAGYTSPRRWPEMQEKEKPISQKIQTTPQGGLHNTAESPLGVTPDVAGPPTIIGMHHGPSGYWEAIGAWHAHNRTFNPPDVTTFRMRGFDKAKMRAAGKSYRRGYMEELEREARRQIRRGTVVKASVQRKKRRAELWAALKAAGC